MLFFITLQVHNTGGFVEGMMEHEIPVYSFIPGTEQDFLVVYMVEVFPE